MAKQKIKGIGGYLEEKKVEIGTRRKKYLSNAYTSVDCQLV